MYIALICCIPTMQMYVCIIYTLIFTLVILVSMAITCNYYVHKSSFFRMIFNIRSRATVLSCWLSPLSFSFQDGVVVLKVEWNKQVAFLSGKVSVVHELAPKLKIKHRPIFKKEDGFTVALDSTFANILGINKGTEVCANYNNAYILLVSDF